ncbi:helix-turn-helix domain-containing protein [Paracoccus denitrificans]|jgi:transcriptional regulator with XRE-family HTH domain|uniref:Helix-turn-helix domain protein n=1 Tax=Paracoccus denitrificans (strain Pd 1222) TaxID=318586 RepID=A1AZ74_PARDP|nr:helix-turn-helix transcriptional regulator [Paracoccus denitrificans]ABL68568.1 helix-turn-helix domain protein [Paracoccus denitrificans PD1222]MBB4625708.1 transcriptional regulator with XRE-family HTH domain [Paracoccus denitrificans]MCU7427126.1 helix-turn-helix domain-containing protein [Paracoccus denitrificans]QAR26634.1 XRE family transcriptional regulator [Paracoccus denitrificans]UPV95582.1 helix-turn-helix domain-containing protein [Paracoccus denitrificans]
MPDADDALLEAFAKILRKQRTAAGLSQEELAHRAGVSMRYVSLLESRRHQPSLATIHGLCQGLGLSMVELIGAVEAEFSERGQH